MTHDTRPPVPPRPGHWCLRRDGRAFRQIEGPDNDNLLIGGDEGWRSMKGRGTHQSCDCIGIIGPICDGCTCTDGRCTRESVSDENWGRMSHRQVDECEADVWVSKGGSVYNAVVEPDFAMELSRRWNRELGADPLADLDWREVYGVRQAVLPLYGARPEFILDDDHVRFGWWADWYPAEAVWQVDWRYHPAIILRARDDRDGEGGA